MSHQSSAKLTDVPFSMFSKALKKHTKDFPALKKPKSRALPAWQVELSGAVDEMEQYSDGELAVVSSGNLESN